MLNGCVTKDSTSFWSNDAFFSRFVYGSVPCSIVSEQNGETKSVKEGKGAEMERRTAAQPQCFYRKWDEHRASEQEQG